MPKIILTGGGTAGHVTPNIALVPELKKRGFDICYIGTNMGIERKLIEGIGIKYFPITAGKLRRYFDLQNIADFYHILKGFLQSFKLIKFLKPDVIFSKGGFVATPVVWAGYLLKIPIVIHESDISPGLANKLSIPFADKVCYSFPETYKHIDKKKACYTGIPIREEIYNGSLDYGRRICGFTVGKPVLLIIGGSQGSKLINDIVQEGIKELLHHFQICHITGKSENNELLDNVEGYKQFEYVTDDLTHLFAMADVIVSRAGATTIFEILALKKPNLLVPLSKKASRGDQILNAESFKKQGFSYILQEDELNKKSLLKAVTEIYENKDYYIRNMESNETRDSIKKVTEIIVKLFGNSGDIPRQV